MSLDKPTQKVEKASNVSESGLINPFIHGSLKEGIDNEKALEAQRQWKEEGAQWEERNGVYWKAYTAYLDAPFEHKLEVQKLMDEAKKVADDYYKEKYMPAYARFTDLWTFPGRTENSDNKQPTTGTVDDLRKSLDRFKN